MPVSDGHGVQRESIFGAVRSSVRAMDVTTSALFHDTRSAIVARGADRISWLNGLVTCDLTKVREGSAIYGLAVDKKGKIITDLYAIIGVDSMLIFTPSETRERVLAHLENHLIMEDVELALDDRTLVVARSANQPSSYAAELLRAHGVDTPFAVELGSPHGVGTALAMVSASEAALLDVVDHSNTAIREFEFEHAIARYGADFDNSFYPQEAALETTAVSFSKGCYLGQEVVCMLEMRGRVNRRLTRVRGEASLHVGDSLSNAEGAVVGTVRGLASASDHAFAVVKTSALEKPTELFADSRRVHLVDATT